MKKPKISIVIVNWNGMPYLEKCLKSIYSQTYKNFEVVVVDNASTDSSIPIIKKKFSKVRLIQNKKNLGADLALNIGYNNSSGQYALLLTSDIVLPKKALEKLLNHIENKHNVGAIGLNWIEYDYKGKIKKNASRHDDFSFLNYILYSKFSNESFPETFYAPGTIILLRRKIVKSPLFDPIYTVYAEDVNLNWKIRLKGYEVKLAKDIIAKELSPGSYSKNLGFVKFHSEKNRIMNMLLFYSLGTWLKIMPIFLLSILLHNIFDFRKLHHTLRSYFWLIANCPKIISKRNKIQKERKVNDKEILKHLSCKFYDETQVTNIVFRNLLKVLNKMTFYYCLILNIRTKEFYSYSK